MEHGMAPSQIRAHQYDEVRQFQILVIRRHEVFAECSFMSRHRRRHAQPRIAVDVGRTDEPLHQLVGYIVVFGQELTRHIERHRIGTMLFYRTAEALCDRVERDIPLDICTTHLRTQQTALQADGIAERTTFRTQRAPIRRVLRIAKYLRNAVCHPGQHPTAYPAIGASSAYIHRDCGAPNSRSFRNECMLRPSFIKSRYQPLSRTSPYSTAPRIVSCSIT